jgi:hypothetical protein
MELKKLELPLGFGMALAQNEPAMKRFESMSAQKKRLTVEGAKQVQSHREMQQYVEQIGQNNG